MSNAAGRSTKTKHMLRQKKKPEKSAAERRHKAMTPRIAIRSTTITSRVMFAFCSPRPAHRPPFKSISSCAMLPTDTCSSINGVSCLSGPRRGSALSLEVPETNQGGARTFFRDDGSWSIYEVTMQKKSVWNFSLNSLPQKKVRSICHALGGFQVTQTPRQTLTRNNETGTGNRVWINITDYDNFVQKRISGQSHAAFTCDFNGKEGSGQSRSQYTGIRTGT